MAKGVHRGRAEEWEPFMKPATVLRQILSYFYFSAPAVSLTGIFLIIVQPACIFIFQMKDLKLEEVRSLRQDHNS